MERFLENALFVLRTINVPKARSRTRCKPLKILLNILNMINKNKILRPLSGCRIFCELCGILPQIVAAIASQIGRKYRILMAMDEIERAPRRSKREHPGP